MFTRLDLTRCVVSRTADRRHLKSQPRSDENKTVWRRGRETDLSAMSLCTCVKCVCTSICRRIISDNTRKKEKHNNLKEIPTPQPANLRAVSQHEWQPLSPRETAINWVS